MGTPIVRLDGEGERRRFLGGGVHTWKLTDAESDGALMVFEDAMTEGKLTPLHRHAKADETVFVLEGEILVLQDDNEPVKVAAGGLTFAPRGMPHAFKVLSPTARLLSIHTPGASEAFYRSASEAYVPEEADMPPDFDRVRAAASETGATDILGPPPFAAV
jgi:quercetin dioxygenase-like cupin family protein